MDDGKYKYKEMITKIEYLSPSLRVLVHRCLAADSLGKKVHRCVQTRSLQLVLFQTVLVRNEQIVGVIEY